MNWTAQTTCLRGHQITAICPWNMPLKEFMGRLMADDPCWKRKPVIKKQPPSIQNRDIGGPEVMRGGIPLLILRSQGNA